MTQPQPTVAAPGSWEAVLAAVEADVARSEQLLDPPAVATALTPAELMLPRADGPVLPALDSMPPVPPELAGRITELQARIAELQGDLECCLAAARRSEAFAGRTVVVARPSERPRFVDRRA